MVAVTVTYGYFSPGPHRRQPNRTGSGGFTTLESLPPVTLTSGDGVPQYYAPNPWPGTTYFFSFWNVAGGSSSPGGPPVGVPGYDNTASPGGVFVGGAPVSVLAVYVSTGEGPPGTPNGATIDQLDITTNQWVDDTFVTVSPDPTGGLTESGNVEGFVETTTSDENITALATTSPTGVDFVAWAILGTPTNPPTSDSPLLSAGHDDTISALAWYQAPPANLGTISGTILLDADNGITPLGDVLISANPGGTTHSNADGSYVLTNLKPGSVVVSVELTPLEQRFFVPKQPRATVTVVAGETTTQIFVLDRVGTRY